MYCWEFLRVSDVWTVLIGSDWLEVMWYFFFPQFLVWVSAPALPIQKLTCANLKLTTNIQLLALEMCWLWTFRLMKHDEHKNHRKKVNTSITTVWQNWIPFKELCQSCSAIPIPSYHKGTMDLLHHQHTLSHSKLSYYNLTLVSLHKLCSQEQ